MYGGNYLDGTYRLSATITGNNIIVAVDGEVVLTKSDSTFANGTHAGIRLRAGADATLTTVDNLVGN